MALDCSPSLFLIIVLFLSVLNAVRAQSNPCNGSRPATIGHDRYNTFFQSPNHPSNYPNNVHCEWNITTEHGAANVTNVRLDFDAFSTELNEDVMRLYDGVNMGAWLITQVSGNSIPGSIFSSGPALYVYFSSDGSLTYPGFSAKANSDPGCRSPQGDYITFSTSEPFYVESPYYPSTYPAFENCTWRFNSINGYTTFVLSFEAFSLQGPSGSCPYDYVEIHTNGIITTFCGNNSPGTLYLTTDQVKVTFTTDGSFSYTGFRFSIYDATGITLPPITGTQTTYTTMTTMYITTTPDFGTATPGPPSSSKTTLTMKLRLDSTANATGILQGNCPGKHQDNLRFSALDMLDHVNGMLESASLCDGDIWTLTRVDVSITSLSDMAYTVLEYYMPALRNQTFWSNHNCTQGISSYLRNHDNWIQPILPPVSGCPDLTYNSGWFENFKNTWVCELI